MAAVGPCDSIDLLHRIRAGDEAAWEALYLRYRDSLLFAIRAQLGRDLRARVESEDVLHSVVRNALQDLVRFQPRGEHALRRYLHTCVLNKIRSKAAHFRAAKRGGDVPLSDSLLERLPRHDGPPSYADSERWDKLEGALGRLPPDMREVVVLRSIEGLSNQEVARSLGKSTEATSKLFNRAIARMAIAVGAA